MDIFVGEFRELTENQKMRRATLSKTILLLFFIPSLTFAQARTVKRISIATVGQSLTQDEESLERCKYFKPTLRQAKIFFNRAYYVPAKARLSDHYSPCYATGKITYSDNSFGTWTLYSGGAALFTLNRGEKVNLYNKGELWSDPLACSDHTNEIEQCSLPR